MFTERYRVFGLVTAVAVVSIYAALPVLVNGWTFPPGAFDVPHIQQWADAFPVRTPYFGYLPAVLVSASWYYYATPLLTLGGLWLALRQYGTLTPVLAWALLWLASRSVLLDMQNGAFIGVLGLLAFGLPMLRLYLSRRRYGIVGAIAPLGFHTFTGGVLLAGVVGHLALGRQWSRLTPLVLPVIVLALIALLLPSSIRQILSGFDYQQSPLNWSHIGVYAGPGMAGVFWLALTTLGYSYIRGIRFKLDAFVSVLLMSAVILAVFTFTPLQLHSDRTIKIMLDLLIVASAIVLSLTIPRLNRTAQMIIMVFLIALVLFGSLDSINNWQAMGSYRNL